MAADPGQVKAILANLYRPDLGFVKAANLAGMMTSKLWSVAVGQNDAQKAIDILIHASAFFWRTSGSGTDKATLLWAHQKATGKRGWFFSISHSDRSRRVQVVQRKSRAAVTAPERRPILSKSDWTANSLLNLREPTSPNCPRQSTTPTNGKPPCRRYCWSWTMTGQRCLRASVS
jgi:hypothetical protein